MELCSRRKLRIEWTQVVSCCVYENTKIIFRRCLQPTEELHGANMTTHLNLSFSCYFRPGLAPCLFVPLTWSFVCSSILHFVERLLPTKLDGLFLSMWVAEAVVVDQLKHTTLLRSQPFILTERGIRREREKRERKRIKHSVQRAT